MYFSEIKKEKLFENNYVIVWKNLKIFDEKFNLIKKTKNFLTENKKIFCKYVDVDYSFFFINININLTEKIVFHDYIKYNSELIKLKLQSSNVKIDIDKDDVIKIFNLINNSVFNGIENYVDSTKFIKEEHFYGTLIKKLFTNYNKSLYKYFKHVAENNIKIDFLYFWFYSYSKNSVVHSFYSEITVSKITINLKNLVITGKINSSNNFECMLQISEKLEFILSILEKENFLQILPFINEDDHLNIYREDFYV